MLTLTIDGLFIETEAGKTILDAAREKNIHIPTLCWHENLLSIGACRLCIVEVEGYANPMVSCATPVQQGMVVTTKTDKLFKMRRDYLKMILAYHPLECPVCDAGGECDLQNLVFEHKIEKADLSVERQQKIEGYATPLIKYWQNRCVLCLRCIHACREISGRGVLDLVETGIDAKMAPVNRNECISCGECLYVCPVGALTENLSPTKSRIWQVERHATSCPHCGFGCTFDLDVQEHGFVTDVIQKTDHKPNRGSLCIMGRFGYDFVNSDERVTTATTKDGSVEPEYAAKIASERFKKLAQEGKGIGFIVSPRATNEEMFLIKEMAGLFKKSSIATSANYHTGRVHKALKQTGIAPSYEYDNLLNADLIIIAGANLLSNNHLLGNRVRDAFKLHGSKIVVVDPAPSALTKIADVHAKVFPGTDGLFFNALSQRLIAAGGHAKEKESAARFDDFAKGIQTLSDDLVVNETGVSANALERTCGLVSRAKKIAVIFGSGVSASEASLAALLNFCLVTGADTHRLVMPIARESNAVGAVSLLGSDFEPHTVINNKDISALMFFEDDPFHYANGDMVKAALDSKEFVLVLDALPTRIMNNADLVVPSAVFTQKNGTRLSQDGYIRKSKRVVKGGDNGFEFLRTLLRLLGGANYADADQVTDHLRQKGLIVVEGDRERLAAEAGHTAFLIAGDNGAAVKTKTGKGSAILILRDIFSNHHLADKDAYSKGVSTIYQHPYYPVSEDKLFMSSEDAADLGIHEGDVVTVESKSGSIHKPISVKAGLKAGLLEYVVFRDRPEVLKLSELPQKWIEVTVRKG